MRSVIAFIVIAVPLIAIETKSAFSAILKVSPQVVIQRPFQNATFHCEVMENPDEVQSFMWERGQEDEPLVIERNSKGKIIQGPGYKNNVGVGGGCSMVLRSATVNLSGTYVVTVHFPDSQVSAEVELIVFNETAVVYSSAREKPFEKGRQEYPERIALYIAVIVLTVALLVLIVYVNRSSIAKWIGRKKPNTMTFPGEEDSIPMDGSVVNGTNTKKKSKIKKYRGRTRQRYQSQ